MIYSMGSGRSGSTVIERVLSSSPDVIAVGEIHALWRMATADLVCSCGQPVDICEFWQAVFETADMDQSRMDRLKTLENAVVRNRYLAGRRFDLRRLATDPQITEMRGHQSRLFAAIRAVSGRPVVLDSSKAGPRGWLMAGLVDCQILHVTRDPADVMASWRRRKFDPSRGGDMIRPTVLRSAWDWAKVEHSARMLARQRAVTRISYAQFAATPRDTITNVLRQNLPDIAEMIDWQSDTSVSPPTMYHSVLGNPDRFDRGAIEVRPSHSALPNLPRVEQITIGAVAAVLRRLYP